MPEFLYLQSVAGFALFILAATMARPLYRFYRRTPVPALLRSEMLAEMILLGYFVLALMGLVAGIHGLT